jgi:hypothetical protein
MSKPFDLESFRLSAADRDRIFRDRVVGGQRTRSGLRYQRAFILQLDVLWIAAAAQLGLKAARAAHHLAFLAGVSRRRRRSNWLQDIPCSSRPPRLLAGHPRSFRRGVEQLIQAGLLRRHLQQGQQMATYDIILPPGAPVSDAP